MSTADTAARIDAAILAAHRPTGHLPYRVAIAQITRAAGLGAAHRRDIEDAYHRAHCDGRLDWSEGVGTTCARAVTA